MLVLEDTFIGIVLLAVGIIFWARPPKKINDWAGYRTGRSTKNQDTWDEANRYSARLMVQFSLIAIAVGFVCGLLLSVPGIFISVGFTLALLFYLIYRTERHLKAVFDENGNRININIM